MKHFVYITTNLITKKQYIGDHSSNNLNDNYLGSGIYFKRALNAYGKENFKREILNDSFKTKEEAFRAQEKYINKYNTLVPDGYNISPKGGLNISGCHSEESKQRIGKANKEKKRSEETKKKMSESKKGKPSNSKGIPRTEESKIKNSLSNKGKHNIPSPSKGKTYIELYGKEKANRISLKLSNSLTGKNKGKQLWLDKHHTKESKKKMSLSHMGKKLSEEHIKNITIATTGENNGMFGKKHKKSTIEKMKFKAQNRTKIKCKYCNKDISPGMYKRWHGDNCKNKIIKGHERNI